MMVKARLLAIERRASVIDDAHDARCYARREPTMLRLRDNATAIIYYASCLHYAAAVLGHYVSK